MNDNTPTRIFHTGFYGTRAKAILAALLDRAQADIAHAKNTFKIRSVREVEFTLADDNECVFAVSERRRSWGWHGAFNGWTDARTLEHLAWVFKNIVVKELGKQAPDAAWKRNCKATIKIIDCEFTVEEFYCIYDNMRARKNADKKYAKELVEELRGTPLDPIMTEMKIAQREEIAKIEAEVEEEVHRIENERWAEQEKMRKQIAEAYAAKVKDAREAAAKKIAELRDSMNALQFIAG